MCVAFFALDSVPEYRLILASNRDEFYERKTEPLSRWKEAVIYAGRDAEKGGTWLGCAPGGRWAMITNFRDPKEFDRKAKSRGHLVSDFLKSGQSVGDYLNRHEPASLRAYNGFNLILSDGKTCAYLSNRTERPEILSKGIYGLSNALLDTPWPKLRRGKAAFERICKEDPENAEAYFSFLCDTTQAPDNELPDTGIPRERERLLSSLFIQSPIYGTKSSTVLWIRNDGSAQMVERVWQVPSKTHPPKYHETRLTPVL